MNFDILEKFNVEIIKKENSFDKIRVENSKLCDLLHFLKNNAEFDFDRLNTIIAIDLGDNFELIYDLTQKVRELMERKLTKEKERIDQTTKSTWSFWKCSA